MRIRVGDLRRLVRESLLNEMSDVSEMSQNPFLDSPEGKKWINSLLTGAGSVDEVLRTKFELMVKDFSNQRTKEAIDVAASIEQHIKTQENSFTKKIELYHHWREGLKNFLKKFKEATLTASGKNATPQPAVAKTNVPNDDQTKLPAMHPKSGFAAK